MMLLLSFFYAIIAAFRLHAAMLPLMPLMLRCFAADAAAMLHAIRAYGYIR